MGNILLTKIHKKEKCFLKAVHRGGAGEHAGRAQGKTEISKVAEDTESMEQVETYLCSFDLKSRQVNFTQLVLLTSP